VDLAARARRILPAISAAGLIASMLAAGAVSTSAAPSRDRAANAGVTLHDAHGIHVKKVRRIGHRQLEARIVPAALERTIGVRIILPKGYEPDGTSRYPSLYLFPGTSGHSWDWSRAGHAPKATRRYRLITITSDIGFHGDGGSWFSNWVDKTTQLGPSQWETYNVHELIPWIDANLATIPHRHARAVAGLSQGGYGATELAARHPDLFTEMGSFSGAPEIDRDPHVRAGAAAVIDATMVGLNRVPADAPFGDHVSDEINWQGHDPAAQIGNLRGIGLWLATADGAPGKYDDPVTNPSGAAGSGAIESATHYSTDAFITHLKQQHVPYQVYDYGSGTHSWPYWARDLRKFLPVMMHRIAHPVAHHHTYYTTIQRHWSEFGWRVRIDRPDRLAWSTLSRARTDSCGGGFRLTGTGTATIRTPATFDNRQAAYFATISGDFHPEKPDRHGRLTLTVPLGQTTTTADVTIGCAVPSSQR
jgi:S-formylglutathione hydrolase FrmB